MNITRRRIGRIAFKLSLLTLLPLSGFVWGAYGSVGVPWYAIALMVVCMGAAIGAESLITSTENEILELEQRLERDRKDRTAKLAVLDEKLKKMDQVSGILEKQNHDMRAELIMLMVRKQRKEIDDDR